VTTLYLDTETTGLSPARGDAIVEIAIVDDAGRTLMDTLVNPGRGIPFYATRVHGITDAMVAGRPTLGELLPEIRAIVASHRRLVIYNSGFDVPFFPPGCFDSLEVRCAMRRFAELQGTRFRKLADAAEHAGHRWTGEAHRALADTLAARSVWHWCEARSPVPA